MTLTKFDSNVNRSDATLDRLHRKWLEPDEPPMMCTCPSCGDEIDDVERVYVVDESRIHEDCWPAYAAESLGARVGYGRDPDGDV